VAFSTGYRCVRCSVDSQVKDRLYAWRSDRLRRVTLAIAGVTLVVIPLFLF
jgi:hypothetical protein